MKKLLYVTALSALLLAACGETEADTTQTEKETPAAVESASTEEVKEEPREEAKAWNESLDEIINSDDAASDKFYALEKIMMDSTVNEAEIDSFKDEILSAYKNKTYLAEPKNDETMLNLIYKSYMIEQNSNDAWKDFSFDFHQNVKYVYRGADTPDSDAVKANEDQMNKVIDKLK